jgi:hypothetical protein
VFVEGRSLRAVSVNGDAADRPHRRSQLERVRAFRKRLRVSVVVRPATDAIVWVGVPVSAGFEDRDQLLARHPVESLLLGGRLGRRCLDRAFAAQLGESGGYRKRTRPLGHARPAAGASWSR